MADLLYNVSMITINQISQIKCGGNPHSHKTVSSHLPTRRPTFTLFFQTRCRRIFSRASLSDGGSGNGGGGDGSGNNSGDDSSNDPWLSSRNIALIICSAALLMYLSQQKVELLATETTPVSIIVPALNEANGIADTLNYLNSLQPPAAEIIVVDGGSTDNTVNLAKKAGAKVVRSKRGRARQMNEGAKKATTTATTPSAAAKFKNREEKNVDSILMFVHSDSRPPLDAILRARKTLADPRIVLGGFFTSIEHDGKILLFTTFHQFISTYYAPLLFAPVGFTRGLKCMFGDQSLFCRAADFKRVGGFDSTLPIMEDADLCVRLHREGLESGKPGREVQLNTCVNRTSGRRIAPWGNWQTTKIQFKLALAWWRGASGEAMWEMYDTWYTDAYR